MSFQPTKSTASLTWLGILTTDLATHCGWKHQPRPSQITAVGSPSHARPQIPSLITAMSERIHKAHLRMGHPVIAALAAFMLLLGLTATAARIVKQYQTPGPFDESPPGPVRFPQWNLFPDESSASRRKSLWPNLRRGISCRSADSIFLAGHLDAARAICRCCRCASPRCCTSSFRSA